MIVEYKNVKQKHGQEYRWALQVLSMKNIKNKNREKKQNVGCDDELVDLQNRRKCKEGAQKITLLSWNETNTEKIVKEKDKTELKKMFSMRGRERRG